MIKSYYFLVLIFAVLGCSPGSTVDIAETAQQVGDSMASVDESAGSSGNFALMEGALRTFARLAPGEIRDSWLERIFEPKAYGTSCSGFGFSSCGGSVITRNFSGCTIGSATLTGTVSLTFSGPDLATCGMGSNGDQVVRVPNFIITGLRSATMTVTKTGATGQTIARGTGTGSSANFTFTNDGIRRVFTTATSTLFDFTTTVTSPVTIVGTNRGARTITGGTILVTNNLATSTYSTCTYTPSSVTWGSTLCNCPTSGSWTGTCIRRTDSAAISSTLTFNGCGIASYSQGTDAQSFTLDRCSGN